MARAFYVLVLGDSVTWGQGLLEGQKMHAYVCDELAAQHGPVRCLLQAHSGAIIGVDSTAEVLTCDGEVPTSFPTIIQQVDNAPDTDVDLVILNGGINDIDIRYILNPFTETADLIDVTNRFCGTDMLALLTRTLARFTGARIAVTSYYPVLSPDSRFPLYEDFMLTMGVPVSPFTRFVESNIVFERIVRNCTTFDRASARALENAVAAANDVAPGRVVFARPPFSEKNAALASEPWLFGIKADLRPEDPMAGPRHASCDACTNDFLRREQCYRASAGHPNQTGARKFADAILAALG